MSQTAPKVSYLNALENQEIRQLVVEQGIYVRGTVEPWTMDKGTAKEKNGTSGSIQILQLAREGSKKLKLTKIKVPETSWGLIDILNKSKELQPVALDCEIVTYGQRSELVLTPEQKNLKLEQA